MSSFCVEPNKTHFEYETLELKSDVKKMVVPISNIKLTKCASLHNMRLQNKNLEFLYTLGFIIYFEVFKILLLFLKLSTHKSNTSQITQKLKIISLFRKSLWDTGYPFLLKIQRLNSLHISE